MILYHTFTEESSDEWRKESMISKNYSESLKR